MSVIAASVVAKLNADTALTTDTDLFDSPEKPFLDGIFPVNSVWVVASDGFLPEGSFGTTPEDLRRVFIQITVRRLHSDFAGGSDLAESIWQALQRQELTGITGFLWCRSLRSAPVYIGQNKDKHHIWSLRFEVGFQDSQ